MAKRTYSGYSKTDYNGEAMQYKTSGNGEKYQARETLAEVMGLPIVALPDRGLSLDSAKEAGIRTALSEKDGRTPTASYFPYYNKTGECIAFKKRDWTVSKEDPNHFTVVGNLKIACQLFGQQNLAKGGKRLYITEGEEDRCALRDALLEQVKGGKYEGKIVPSVVSLPMGTANAAEAIAHNDEFVRSFGEVVLAFDNDFATPKEKRNNILKGKEATEDAAGYLLTDNIYRIDYPEGCKDARECIVKGHIRELGKIATFGLVKYSPDSICSGDDADLEDLMTPLKEGFKVNRYTELMNKIRGWRVHELTTYAAFSGVGKSTLSREIAWEMIREGTKVGMIFLEEPLKKTQQSLLALELGVKLSVFRENPSACATMEEAQIAKEKVLSNGNVFFLDHFGSLKVNKLMQQIRYLHFICGCEQIFIDHISMVVAGSESNNERKDIDILYEELATFMTVNPVGIHAVMHLKRVEDTAPKQDEENPTSYWRQVKKEMLRGSSGCVDKDTEFLSQDGWKKICDYTEGDKVAQYKQDGSAEWIEPLNYIKIACDSLTSVSTNQDLTMVLCDDHRIAFQSPVYSPLVFTRTLREIKEFAKYSTGFIGAIPTNIEQPQDGMEEYLPNHLTKLVGVWLDDTTFTPYKTLDGFKYCFTTPSSYWVARRNGKVFVTGNCEAMSSQIIVLENEVMPDGRRGRVRSKVEKNREWSSLGVCDTMLMNEQGRLEVVPTDQDWMFKYYEEQDKKEQLKIFTEVVNKDGTHHTGELLEPVIHSSVVTEEDFDFSNSEVITANLGDKTDIPLGDYQDQQEQDMLDLQEQEEENPFA